MKLYLFNGAVDSTNKSAYALISTRRTDVLLSTLYGSLVQTVLASTRIYVARAGMSMSIICSSSYALPHLPCATAEWLAR